MRSRFQGGHELWERTSSATTPVMLPQGSVYVTAVELNIMAFLVQA